MLCNCGSFVNDLWIICGLFGYMICRLYYSNSALTTFFWMIKYSEKYMLGAVAQALGLGIESAIRGGLDLHVRFHCVSPTGTYIYTLP